jgi:HD-GYP domain-containing protein (c-di-GMP phosphodiesterase class II)
VAGVREILFDSVKALERQIAGFHILSSFASSPAPKEQVLYEVLGKVLELVGADAGAIALADETGGVFDFVTLRWTHLPALQLTAKEKALRLFRVRLTEGIVGQVYQSREPVIIPDVSKSQTFRKDMADAVNYQVRTLLAVPIQTENVRLGVLELFNKVPRGTFSAQDMELAVGLAHQIARDMDILRTRVSAPSAALPAAPTPPPPTGPSHEELLEARRTARDAQSQLKETYVLLETAMQARDQSALRVQALTEELERARALAEAVTPPQQIVRLLHSVEPFAFTLSLNTVLRNFAELSARLVNAQALQLFLWDERTESLTLSFSTATAVQGHTISVPFKKGEGVAGSAADRRELIHVEDVTKEDRFSKSIDEVPGILSRSLLASPLSANGRLVGVIEAINRKDGGPFTSDDGTALAGVSILGAAALEKVLEHQGVQESARAALGAVADLIETHGPSPAGRAERLRRLVAAAGEILKWTSQQQRDTEWAVFLFNVGKVLLPAEVLFKQGELLPKDRELLFSVPRVSADVLVQSPSLAGTARIVRHINERWDGQGSPDMLSAESIPIGSRVIAVIDAYDGLVSGGPGHKALPADVALKEIQSCAGKQFDPACVELLLRLVRADKRFV